MTTALGIIIWTLILFNLVASQDTVLQGKKGAVCNELVYETKTDLVWNCRACEDPMYRERHLCRTKICRQTQKNSTISWSEQKCCKGYENKKSICKPQCSPKCEDGHYCAEPNKCECNNGWAGQNCTESLWCVVTVNLTPTLSNLLDEVPYNDTPTNSKRLECLPKCRDQAPNISALFAKSTNIITYFVPIKSPCNIEVGGTSENIFERYKYPLTGILGIVLCVLVIFCVTCFLKRKRRTSCDEEDVPMKTRATQDYMVENTMYS